MIYKFLNKQESKETPNKPKEITVRIIRAKEKPKFENFDIEDDIRKEYEREENIPFSRGYNVLRCGVIGAFVGVLFTALMIRFGAHLSTFEISFMIGIPSFLGIAAGYVIF